MESCTCAEKMKCSFCAARDARRGMRELEARMEKAVRDLNNVVALCDDKEQRDAIFAQSRERLSVIAARIEVEKNRELPEHLNDIRQGYERVLKKIEQMESLINSVQRGNRQGG